MNNLTCILVVLDILLNLKISEDIQTLEREGIEIVSKRKKTTVYGSLIVVSGDNLALNSMLGFTESFR